MPLSLGDNSVKITVAIGGIFLAALVIVIYSPVECIKIKVFNNEITKCKTLTSSSYGLASTLVSTNSESSPATAKAAGDDSISSSTAIIEIQTTLSLTGKWTLSGTSSNFPVAGNATFLNGARYELFVNQQGTLIKESGAYQFDPSSLTLKLTSDGGKSSSYVITNAQANSFLVTDSSGTQHYKFVRIPSMM